MKSRLLCLMVLCSMSIISSAQCYTTHREDGVAAFNQGDYITAKKHFEYIINSCPDKPANNDAYSWLQKCNELNGNSSIIVGNYYLSFPKALEYRIDKTASDSWRLCNAQETMVLSATYGTGNLSSAYYNILHDVEQYDITYKVLKSTFCVISYWQGDVGVYCRIDVKGNLLYLWELRWDRSIHSTGSYILDNRKILFK